MKKSLFLLPLLTLGLLVTGCDKEDGGNGGSSALGTALPVTLDLHSKETVEASDEKVVIERSGVRLTVDQMDAQNPCGGAEQKYVGGPIRIYGGQKVTIDYGTAFSTLVFDSAWYADNTYSTWFAATVNEGGFGTAEVGEDNYKVTVTLESAVTSWSYTNNKPEGLGWKQNRFYSIQLLA